MSRQVIRCTYLLIIPLALALAGCQDMTSPRTLSPSPAMKPRFTQGAGGIWTVNTLADEPTGFICEEVGCTLRDALSSAQSGDKIVFDGFVGTGTITLVPLHPLQISRSVTIDGGGRIILDGNQGTQMIVVDPNTQPSVRLVNLSIVNGHSDFPGGGISVENANLTLDSVTVSNNSSGNSAGGGIHAKESTVTIRNSTVSNNSAGERGAGIENDGGSLSIVNTIVTSNTLNRCLLQDDCKGGGIYNNGTLLITASTIGSNRALDGAGIFNAYGGHTTIIRSTIGGNEGGSGGDVVYSAGTGGIANQGTMELRSTTMALNRGFVGALKASSGTTIVSNSIVAGNIDKYTNDPKDCIGDEVSGGYNLTVTGGGCLFNATGDVMVAYSQVFIQLIDLQNTVGPSFAYALIPRGPAVDAGYCPGETVDQRGLPRPVNDAMMPNALDGCDIGSYELQGPVAAIADLMVSQAVDKNSVKQGDLLTYFVRVQNLGPQTAPQVVLNNLLSSGVTFYSARSNKGTFTAPPRGETGTVTWSLGDMLSQANEVAEIAVTVLIKGTATITNTATATANVVDPNPANNSAAITVSVVTGGKTGGGSGGTGGGGGGGGGNPHR